MGLVGHAKGHVLNRGFKGTTTGHGYLSGSVCGGDQKSSQRIADEKRQKIFDNGELFAGP